MIDLKPYQDLLVSKKNTIKVLQDQISEYKGINAQLSEDQEEYTQAKEIMAAVSILSQQQIRDVVNELVTMAMQTVFGLSYKFIMEDEYKSGRPETYFSVEKAGHIHDIKDEHGGSLAVLAAFVLRVVLIATSTKHVRPTIILDEPLKDADKGKLERLCEILQTLHDMLGMQFIIVTHEPELINAAHRGFLVVQEIEDVSTVEVIR